MIMSEKEMDEQISAFEEFDTTTDGNPIDNSYKQSNLETRLDSLLNALAAERDAAIKYVVIRPRNNVIVSIMFNRSNHKYHFVNLSHGHICACAFDTIDDAIKDMEILKQTGEITDYFKI